jgi:hypothetical protein
MRWLVIGGILLFVCIFFNDAPFGTSHWPLLLREAASFGYYGSFGCLIGAQIYRYRRVSDSVQRQQTKWVVFAVTLFLLASIGADLGLIMLLIFFPALRVPGALLQLSSFTSLALTGVFLLIPLSFTIAVLRYRLWDIDIIINRTLVYGLLTASVVGLTGESVPGPGESAHFALRDRSDRRALSTAQESPPTGCEPLDVW